MKLSLVLLLEFSIDISHFVDMYYLAFPSDRFLIKLAVAWVYLVGVAQTCLAMVDVGKQINRLQLTLALCNTGREPGSKIFNSTIDPDHFWLPITASSATGELNYHGVTLFHWQLMVAILQIVALTIHSIYAYRSYVISKQLWLSILIVAVSKTLY